MVFPPISFCYSLCEKCVCYDHFFRRIHLILPESLTPAYYERQQQIYTVLLTFQTYAL